MISVKMLLPSILLLLVSGSFISFANEGTPSQRSMLPAQTNDVLREYEQAVENAARRAVAKLEAIKLQETRRGNLRGAIATQSKIDELTAAVLETDSLLLLPKLKIEATSDAGVSLGPGKQGQRLVVQYVNGTWSAFGPSRVSPDAGELGGPRKTQPSERVLVYAYANGSMSHLAVVAGGTAERAFIFTLARDYDDVRLIMTDGHKRDNSGVVYYRAGIK